MKKNTEDSSAPQDKSTQTSSPVEDKNELNRGNSVNGLNEADSEEFADRKKTAKETAETELREEEEREVLKANRISDSGVLDDDDDGTDAVFEDDYDGA